MNQAIATGQDPNGNDVSDLSDDNSHLEDDTTINDFPSQISMSLEKTGEWIDLNGDGFAQVGEVINYSFTVTNTGDATLMDIIVTDPLVDVDGGPITLAPGESDSTSFTAVYILTEEDIAQNLVVNQASVTGTDGVNTTDDLSDDPTDPTDFDDNNDGEPDDPTVTICEGVLNIADITIFNGVSSNNDGINDLFIIEGIENFPNNNVQIFNRYGVQVYERESYKNDEQGFRGESEGRFTISEDKLLPVGTYYYIVNYVTSDGPRQEVGYLYLTR
jgi:gliding motility-associated-like protein